MMGTYVVENTPELSLRHGTNSTAAVVWFWVLLVVGILLAVLAIFLWFLAAAYTGMNSGL
jgi:CHASE3 domain sensor protein